MARPTERLRASASTRLSGAGREDVPCAGRYSGTMPMRSGRKVSEWIHATSRSPNRVGSLSGSRRRDVAMQVERRRQAQGEGPYA